jgi:hypothetical protein
VELIDNGPFPGSGAIVDPGGSAMGTNAIILNGHEYLGDLSVRTTPTGSKGTLSTADLSADRVLRLPNAAAELQARDVPAINVTATSGTVTFAALADMPGNLIKATASLAGNLTIVVPPVAGLRFTFTNSATLNAHTLTIKASGGAAITSHGGTATYYVDTDGITLVREQIETFDNGAGATTIYAPVLTTLSDEYLWYDSAGALRAVWSVGSTLELEDFGIFLIAGEVQVAGELQINTSSDSLGASITAPSTGQVQTDAVTSQTFKINTAEKLKLDATGIGEFGHATAGQQSDYGALSDGTGGSTSGGLVDVTSAGLADPAKINDNFARIDAKLDAIRAVLRAHGRMA